MKWSAISEVYRLLAFLWGFLALVGGMFASLGLLAFPWSSEPELCFAVGVAGVAAQILGAFLVLWGLRLLPTTSRARTPARALPGESA